MNFEDSLSFLISKLSIAHRRLVERHASAVGLHSGQVFVLIELWKKDGLRQIDLAGALGLTAPTVNKILGGLIENEFVTRARYEDDARSTRIFLTEKGEQMKKVLEQQWSVLEEDATINLTETEIIMLKQLVRRLLEPIEI